MAGKWLVNLAKALVSSAGVTLAYMLLCAATNPPAVPFIWIWFSLLSLTGVLGVAFCLGMWVTIVRDHLS